MSVDRNAIFSILSRVRKRERAENCTKRKLRWNENGSFSIARVRFSIYISPIIGLFLFIVSTSYFLVVNFVHHLLSKCNIRCASFGEYVRGNSLVAVFLIFRESFITSTPINVALNCTWDWHSTKTTVTQIQNNPCHVLYNTPNNTSPKHIIGKKHKKTFHILIPFSMCNDGQPCSF